MKYCIACNELLEDDAKFCSNCRAKQPEKTVEPVELQETIMAQEGETSIHCEKCGKELQKEWMACPFCLTPVLKPDETLPISTIVRILEKTIEELSPSITKNTIGYIVSDACANCGACDSECPVDAISEKDGKRWIDPERCVSCGACVGACPVDAINE